MSSFVKKPGDYELNNEDGRERKIGNNNNV